MNGAQRFASPPTRGAAGWLVAGEQFAENLSQLEKFRIGFEKHRSEIHRLHGGYAPCPEVPALLPGLARYLLPRIAEAGSFLARRRKAEPPTYLAAAARTPGRFSSISALA